MAAHQPVTTAQGEARALARDWGVESDFSRGSGRPIFELGHCSRNTLGSVELLGLDALGVGVSRLKRALPGAHQGGARGGSRCHNGESDRHNLSHLSQFVTPAPPTHAPALHLRLRCARGRWRLVPPLSIPVTPFGCCSPPSGRSRQRNAWPKRWPWKVQVWV